MSSREWKSVYTTLKQLNRSLPRAKRKCTYSDPLIVAMYIWAVLHERPLCWAVQRISYNRIFRPRRLPSYSQFKRRVRTPRFGRMLEEVNAHLSQRTIPAPLMYVDGKALPVGPDSTDPEALAGRSGGSFRRGYKLHALATEDGRFVDHTITGLNACEKAQAHIMLQRTPLGAVVLGDGNYDDHKLYEAAVAGGAMFFAKPRKGAGRGHQPQSEARLASLRLCVDGQPPQYQRRRDIERYFGQLTGFGGGLQPLPSWVRRRDRVQRWVTAKLTIYHARLKARKEVA